MQKTISLSEVLKKMREMENATTPVKFTIAGRKFSANNKTGGKPYFYRNAELLKPPKIKGNKRLADITPFKKPRHFENRTRNIKTETGEIQKINILFIEKFNGITVIY